MLDMEGERMQENYYDTFWNMLEPERSYSIDRAIVSKTTPLTLIMRGIEYTKDNILIAENLIKNTVSADIELKDRNLHADYSHSDILDCKLSLKRKFKTGDSVVVLQSPDRQTLIILCKVVKV